MTKKQACRVHAKNAALARYGLVLNRHKQREIARQIDEGRACRLLRQVSRRLGIYKLILEAREYYVAYDHNRKVVCSYLPPNCFESRL